MFEALISFVREQYKTNEFIPLHAPVLLGREHEYVAQTISSTFVSSVGAFVDKFEHDMARYTHSSRAVATVNGTAALHVALLLAGVKPGELVITQPLTFVATCNAVAYCGAEPVFIDVDRDTLGLSPSSLSNWLEENAYLEDTGLCKARKGQKTIRACLPMHTFGHPVALDELVAVCAKWNLVLVEDAAESLGSLYKGRHTGTIGQLGTLSFNGNKIITTGGGGMILAGDVLGQRAKYITTTAKRPHPYEFVHDELGYNYRLPNINAALGCAQLEQLDGFLQAKRDLAERYSELLQDSDMLFVKEPKGCRSNYWLNAVICTSYDHREALLKATNDKGVMTRPIWRLMNTLPLYAQCQQGDLSNARWLEERVVNLPSSVIPKSIA